VILYPAIDILDGKAVRLVEGNFDDRTVYDDDPLAAAQSWVDAGARFLHVVDLDGARFGEPRSIEHLRRIASETGVPVQYGGGLRSLPAVREALRAGAERVVIGTAAFQDIDFLDSVMGAFGPRVLVSVDVRGGHVATAGWTQTTQMPGTDAIRRLGDRGVASFVYTNVDRDGKLEGPDPDEVRRVAEAVRGRFLYSGGIGSLDHLRALADLRQVNLAGVIVGKALYERRFTVAEGQAALDAQRSGSVSTSRPRTAHHRR
jgi:phosphoribosylformimino-5-aminoimidazole carboxamide ribotide isomerase